MALAILQPRQGTAPKDVRADIVGRFGYDLRAETALVRRRFDVSAAGTVPPALAAAFQSADWEQAVRTAVGLGGDSDTLACIAGAVAEAIHDLPHTIPDQARDHLTADLRAVLDDFQAAFRTADSGQRGRTLRGMSARRAHFPPRRIKGVKPDRRPHRTFTWVSRKRH